MAVIDKKTRRGMHTRSLYEALFGVDPGRNRRPGRPEGSKEDRMLFSTVDKDRDLAKQARQRAIAVVMHENKERVKDLYELEYNALREAKSEAGGPETP